MLLLSRRLLLLPHSCLFLHRFIRAYQWWYMLHPVVATHHLCSMLSIRSALRHCYDVETYFFHNDPHIFGLLIVEILCVHIACHRFQDIEGHSFYFLISLPPKDHLIMSSISTCVHNSWPFRGSSNTDRPHDQASKNVGNDFQTGGRITGRLLSSIMIELGHRRRP